MSIWDKLWAKKIAALSPIAPTPPGVTTVTLKMNYGSSIVRTFVGAPGVTSEETARHYITESGKSCLFDIGGDKFVNIQDIRDVSLENKV